MIMRMFHTSGRFINRLRINLPSFFFFVIFKMTALRLLAVSYRQSVSQSVTSLSASHLRTRPAAGPRIPCAEERWKNPAAARQLCFGSRFFLKRTAAGDEREPKAAGHGPAPVGRHLFCRTLGWGGLPSEVAAVVEQLAAGQTTKRSRTDVTLPLVSC